MKIITFLSSVLKSQCMAMYLAINMSTLEYFGIHESIDLLQNNWVSVIASCFATDFFDLFSLPFL